MDITLFDALPEDEARRLASGWLGVPRWVDDVLAARPYGDVADLVARADTAARQLGEDELAAALARHPRIGERPAGPGREARLSSDEQAGVRATDALRLAVGNAAYEARFGRVFLIRAAGRSSTEILAELERRLGNDDTTERAETVTALREIALLRLRSEVG